MNLLDTMFTNCGPVTEQLRSDVGHMGLSEDFIKDIKNGWGLPMAYGYSDGRYTASEQAERSTEWITLFESADDEEFRWYILRIIAEEWGRKYAKEHETDFVQKWDASNIGRTYDWRNAWWECEIQTLLKIYKINNTRIQRLIFDCEQLLGTVREGNVSKVWKYDARLKKFMLTSNKYTGSELLKAKELLIGSFMITIIFLPLFGMALFDRRSLGIIVMTGVVGFFGLASLIYYVREYRKESEVWYSLLRGVAIIFMIISGIILFACVIAIILELKLRTVIVGSAALAVFLFSLICFIISTNKLKQCN